MGSAVAVAAVADDDDVAAMINKIKKSSWLIQ